VRSWKEGHTRIVGIGELGRRLRSGCARRGKETSIHDGRPGWRTVFARFLGGDVLLLEGILLLAVFGWGRGLDLARLDVLQLTR